MQIDLSDKPSWFCRVNSSGLVPALCSQGRVVTESIDICRWVDSNLEGPALLPGDAECRSQMDALIRAASRINSAGFALLAGQHARRACCKLWDCPKDAAGGVSSVMPAMHGAFAVRSIHMMRDSCCMPLSDAASTLHRAWAIGTGQSRSDRKAFELQLQPMAAALHSHGGPFLTGPHISLVSPPACTH